MGCNAWNHPSDCTCGWGGEGHKGKNLGGRGFNSLPSKSQESSCKMSSCPKCGAPVFFIKHNGGSVWLDPPLSPPWFKHPCFVDNPFPKIRKKLVSDTKESKSYKNCKVGIISNATKGKIHFITGDDEHLFFSVPGNPTDIIGELCVYNLRERKIWALKSPKRVYSCIGISRKDEKEDDLEIKIESKERPKTPCPCCDMQVRKLAKHLKNAHKLVATSIGNSVTGLMKIENDLHRPKFEEIKNSPDILNALSLSIDSVKNYDGWSRIDQIGSWLKSNAPHFKVKDYGYKNLKGLILNQPYLDIIEEKSKQECSPIIYIKIKE